MKAYAEAAERNRLTREKDLAEAERKRKEEEEQATERARCDQWAHCDLIG